MRVDHAVLTREQEQHGRLDAVLSAGTARWAHWISRHAPASSRRVRPIAAYASFTAGSRLTVSASSRTGTGAWARVRQNSRPTTTFQVAGGTRAEPRRDDHVPTMGRSAGFPVAQRHEATNECRAAAGGGRPEAHDAAERLEVASSWLKRDRWPRRPPTAVPAQLEQIARVARGAQRSPRSRQRRHGRPQGSTSIRPVAWQPRTCRRRGGCRPAGERGHQASASSRRSRSSLPGRRGDAPRRGRRKHPPAAHRVAV